MLGSLLRLTFVSAILTFPGVLQSAVRLTDAQIKSILEERIDVGAKSVGIVVGIIDSDGRRIIAHGTTDQMSGKPVDGNTVYEIGSITKVFTAVLLADMVLKGEVGLHDPIEMYLPAGASAPERDGKKITLYHLTTHTSGLPRMPDNFSPKDPDNPYADYSVEQMLDFISGYQLRRGIGEQFEYSNLGVGLLGYLLAQKAGQPYEELVTSRILKPLDMSDTGITLSERQRQRLATGHNMGGEAVSNWDIPTLAGAGALRSSAKDMLKFLAAAMKPESTIPGEAMKLTQREWREAGGPEMQIGLGWIRRKKGEAGIIWHNGGTGGYHGFMGFAPENSTGVVILSNSTNNIDDIGFHILDAETQLAEIDAAPKIAPVSPEICQDYVGEYELSPQLLFTITSKNNTLYAQLTGQQAFPVYPESETKFFYKVVDAEIEFKLTETGEVVGLTLFQAGQELFAQKL